MTQKPVAFSTPQFWNPSVAKELKPYEIAGELTEKQRRRFAKGLVRLTRSKPRWSSLGACEVVGSVCTWRCDLAAREESGGLWSIRWRGEEQDEEILGPDLLDTLAEELVEEKNLDRDELLGLFAASAVKELRDFARANGFE